MIIWVVFPRFIDGVGLVESTNPEAWTPRPGLISFPRGGVAPPVWYYSRCFLLGPAWTEAETKIFARQLNMRWAAIEVTDAYLGRLTPLQRSTTATPGNA